MFEPFRRIEQSRSLDTGGHGLGLSIARSIVLEHGGTIELSNRDSAGICARIFLPNSAQKSRDAKSHGQGSEASGFIRQDDI